MSKVNNLLKLIIVIMYMALLFGLSFFLVSRTGKNSAKNRFEEYTNTPHNEDITLNVQVVEKRQSATETKSKYEETKYDTYLFVTKKSDAIITNIYTYLCSESGNTYSYVETASAKTMKKGSYSTSTMQFLNSTQAFAQFTVNVDDEGKITSVNDKTPEQMYVKVVYDYQETDSSEKIAKELNYKFNFRDVKVSKFDSYESREMGTTYINDNDNKDLFKLKLTKKVSEAEEGKPQFDEFKLNILEENSARLSSINEELGLVDSNKVTFDSIDLCIYGKITNESMINTKYFDQYVRLFNYSGSLNRGIRAIRTAEINTEYKVDTLYINAVCRLSNGKEYTTTYKINVSELKTS